MSGARGQRAEIRGQRSAGRCGRSDSGRWTEDRGQMDGKTVGGGRNDSGQRSIGMEHRNLNRNHNRNGDGERLGLRLGLGLGVVVRRRLGGYVQGEGDGETVGRLDSWTVGRKTVKERQRSGFSYGFRGFRGLGTWGRTGNVASCLTFAYP